MINRPHYLNWLSRWQDKNMIKVITGMRRSGKSTIMRMFQEQLLQNNISESCIISINFESLDEDYPLEYKALYDYIVKRLSSKEKNYVFLDEVQHVQNFERAVDALYVRPDVDIYITGSNAYLLSGELVTFLTGRYVVIRVYPFSFKEYYDAMLFRRNRFDDSKDSPTSHDLHDIQIPETKEGVLEQYLTYGGLPYTTTLLREQDIADYLSAVFSTVILKDIAQRHPKMDMSAFNSSALFLADNVGNISSIKRISDGLTSQGKKISQGAVSEYIESMIENFLLHKVSRFSLKGKEYLQRLEKYYLGDLGFRFWLLGKRAGDVGHRLENIVYLELSRRHSNVVIGKQDTKEVDFVAMDENGWHYYQVAQTVLDEQTLKRELEPLRAIDDNYPKTLLSLDTIGTGNSDGIKHINLINWLLA